MEGDELGEVLRLIRQAQSQLQVAESRLCRIMLENAPTDVAPATAELSMTDAFEAACEEWVAGGLLRRCSVLDRGIPFETSDGTQQQLVATFQDDGCQVGLARLIRKGGTWAPSGHGVGLEVLKDLV